MMWRGNAALVDTGQQTSEAARATAVRSGDRRQVEPRNLLFGSPRVVLFLLGNARVQVRARLQDHSADAERCRAGLRRIPKRLLNTSAIVENSIEGTADHIAIVEGSRPGEEIAQAHVRGRWR